MFYALIVGLLEVGVIVPIVVRVVHADAAVAGCDCWAELTEGEGHALILLDSGVACKRSARPSQPHIQNGLGFAP